MRKGSLAHAALAWLFLLLTTAATAQTASQQLLNEIQNNLPSGRPDLLTAQALRRTLTDIVTLGLGAKTDFPNPSFSFVSPISYGNASTCTGSVDDTAALNGALNSGGKIVLLPPSVCNYTSLNVPAGVEIWGSGRFFSVLNATTTTGNSITLNDSSALRHLKLSSTSARTSGYNVILTGNSSEVEDFIIQNYYIGFGIVGASSNTVVLDVRIFNGNFFLPAVTAGAGGIFLNNFGNAELSSMTLAGPSVGTQPQYGIDIRNGDTCFVHDLNITLHGAALLMDVPASNNTFACRFTNNLWDSAGTDAASVAHSGAEIVPAGNIDETVFVNNWFGLSKGADGLHMVPTGSGTVQGWVMHGSQFEGNNNDGAYLSGTGLQSIVIDGWMSGGNGANSIELAGTGNSTVNSIEIANGISGNIAGRGVNGGYGIKFSGTTDYLNIHHNALMGSSAGSINVTFSGNHSRIQDNMNYNPVGLSGISPSGSPFTYCASYSPESVYGYGGTVTHVALSGTDVAQSSPFSLLLNPNECVTVTYSGAPTMEKFVH